MKVYCPIIIPNDKYYKNCRMYCNGYYSCSGHDYYAIRGYDDMSLACEYSDSCNGVCYNYQLCVCVYFCKN